MQVQYNLSYSLPVGGLPLPGPADRMKLVGDDTLKITLPCVKDIPAEGKKNTKNKAKTHKQTKHHHPH